MEVLFPKGFRRWFARKPFFRLLLYDFWFRLAFLGFLGLLVFLGLTLPRIWTVSPPGFRPVIKISGLDLAQAWALRRTAHQAMAAGRFEDAHYAWMAAWANNRTDAELVRGALRNFLARAGRDKHGPVAVSQSYWLLKLKTESGPDQELAAKVFEHYGRPDLVIDLVESMRQAPTPALETAYLKALFNAGHFHAFSNRWKRGSSTLAPDPELHLYHAAWIAGHATGEMAGDALKTLQASLDRPNRRVTASRLLLGISAERLESSQYEEHLDRLKQWRADGLMDHIRYWRLLARTGRKEEAIVLSESLPCRPATSREVLALFQLYQDWGLPDRGLRWVRKFMSEFGNCAELWVMCANALREARDWDELRRIAIQMRLEGGAGDELTAYSYYLEGRAEAGLRRHVNARAAFQKMSERQWLQPKLALKASEDLIGLGYPEMASQVLSRIQPRLETDPHFWTISFQAAEKLKHADLMLTAGRRAYLLQPTDPVRANNYAAALLIHRQNPEEAIQLTLFALSRGPRSLPVVINHSAALMANGRTGEAAELLAGVRPDKLTRWQRNQYHLDRFELCLKTGRYEEAWSMADLIEIPDLYPPQASWFERVRQQMPKRGSYGLTLLSESHAP